MSMVRKYGWVWLLVCAGILACFPRTRTSLADLSPPIGAPIPREIAARSDSQNLIVLALPACICTESEVKGYIAMVRSRSDLFIVTGDVSVEKQRLFQTGHLRAVVFSSKLLGKSGLSATFLPRVYAYKDNRLSYRQSDFRSEITKEIEKAIQSLGRD